MVATVSRGVLEHAKARVLGRSAWSSVTYLVTLRCNAACRYCDFPRHAGDELDTQSALRLFRGLRRSGTFRLGLSGGEPLLREDLGALVAGAVAEGFVTSVVTNGILLADRVSDVRAAQFVLTTIEGREQTHDKVRGRGAHAATIAGLLAMRAAGGPKLGIICPVHSRNVDEIEVPLTLAEELGVRAFFQPVQLRDGWKGRPLTGELPWERATEAFRRIAAWKRAGRPIGNSTRYLEMMTALERPAFREQCPAGRFVVTVLPDGRATPCCMVPFEGAVPIADLDHPERSHQSLRLPDCESCTISPYVENYLLMKPEPSVVWEALQW